MTDPAFASIASLRRALVLRRLSALELAEHHLARIGLLEPKLNAFTRVDPAAVRAAARAADRRIRAGRSTPLLGVPIALKDMLDERGTPNTSGSALRLRSIARRDATVVARLRAAGAILIGRTNLHEFAAGTATHNDAFGQTRNPHDLGMIPGGSSGGAAAAVAAGLATGAIGTDSAGSIRIPAALCGVVGLKPTYGRVSRAGVLPLAWSLDHVGPITRSVADARSLLRVIAGADPEDPTTLDGSPRPAPALRGLRFSFGDAYFRELIDPALHAAMREARRALRAAGLREVSTRTRLVRAAGAMLLVVLRAETTAAHLLDLEASRLRRVTADVRARIQLGLDISAVDYLEAQRARTLLLRELDAAFEATDLLITPTTAAGALPIGASDLLVAGTRQAARDILVRFTSPFNLTGHPALALPGGRDARGLPLSLQIVGRHGEESLVLKAGAALERAFALDLRPALALGAG